MADTAPPMLWFVASIPPQTLIGIHSRFPIAQASQCCLLPSADTPSWNSRWGANRRASSVQLNLIELNSAEHVFSESESHSVVSNSLRPHGLYSPWNSPGQNTGVGSLSLLQGIIPTQGLNPGLPHCRRILYQLIHKGSQSILARVAYPFSSGSSWPRNWTPALQVDSLPIELWGEPIKQK